MSLSFDATFYQTQRPDVFDAFVASGGSTGLTWAQFAENHYDTFGRFEGSDPNASFDTSFYLSTYTDVAAAGVNPFTHFLNFGSLENRLPYSTFPNEGNGFVPATYAAANPDLAAAGITTDAQLYQHFVVFGQFESRPGAPAVTPPDATPGETFTLTTGPDAFTGTALNDTFIASEATLGSADVLDGAGGADLLRYASSGAVAVNEAGFQASNIETVQVTSDAVGGTTFDMTGVTGASTLNNTNSSQNLTVTGLSGTINVGSENVSGGNTVVQYKDSVLAGASDAQTLNLTGNQSNAGAAVSTISIGNSSSGGTTGLEILNIATSGSGSQLVDIITGAATINITGDQTLAVTNILDGATKIDASGSTGGVSVTADSAVNDVVVTGGTGDDSANFSASFDAGDSFDGGDGTDTLGLSNAIAIGTPGGATTNVEQLDITTGGTGTVDMDNFAGISKVIYNAGLAGATTVDDAVTGTTVEVDVTAAGNNLTVDLKTDGTSDTLTVEIDEVGAADALGTVNIDDAETANVSVDDDAAVAGTGTVTIANLSIADATALNLSGNANLTIGAFTGPATDVLATVDASGMTGNLTVTGLGALLQNTASTITLGSGNDTVNGGTGIGADTITTGTGTDVLFYTAVNQSSGSLVDTITDFTTGTDDIDVTGLGILTASQFVGNFASFGAAQGAVTAGGAIQAVFQSDTNTLWVDANNDGALNANDLQVILTGVSSIAASDLNLGTGNTIDLTAAGATVAVGVVPVNATNPSTNEDDTITASNTDMGGGTTINGGLGTDTLTVTGALGVFGMGGVTNVEVINLGDGGNTITGMDAAVTTVNGGTGADTVTASAAGQTFALGTGNDVVNITNAQLGTATLTSTINLGQNGGDTLNITTAGTSILDGAGAPGAGIANATGVDVINLTGVSTVQYAATAALTINTGAGATNVDITGAGGQNVTVNGAAATGLIDVDGNANFTVSSNNGQGVNAAGQTGGTFAATLTDANATVTTAAAATSRTVDATALTAGNAVTMAGAGATTVNVIAGNVAGATHTGALTINVTGAGAAASSTVGGSGNDIFNYGTTLAATDTVTGNGGTDTLNFTDGNAAVTDLDGVTLVETIVLGNAVTAIDTNDTLVAAGQTVTVNGTALAAVTIDFDGALEADGVFNLSTGAGGTTAIALTTAAINAAATGVVGGTASAGGLGDTLTGNTGNDALLGLAGNDTLVSGGGADTLVGGLGADTITGGAGVDSIAYTQLAANVNAEGGDTINGFTIGTDKLVFGSAAGNYNLGNGDTTVDNFTVAAGAIADPGVAGAEVIVATGVSVTNANAAASLQTLTGTVTAGVGTLVLVHNSDTGGAQLYHDANGLTAGGVTLVADIVGISQADMANFTAADFTFVA